VCVALIMSLATRRVAVLSDSKKIDGIP